MKKRVNAELARLKNVISSDRMSVESSFEDLLSTDLKKLLSDYFDLKGEVKIFLEKQNQSYKLTAEATAIRVKPFCAIPDNE